MSTAKPKPRMTEAELAALPVSVPLVEAGRALCMGRTKSHELVRKDQFPCRVLRLGGAYVVPKAELLRVLGLPVNELDPATP